MDYYSILGIPKNASDKDIRKAYKKQSMQHHPDRGGDEEKFKEINEAYQTLSDPHKRGMYDHQQSGGGQDFNFNTSNMGGFDDVFSSMFGAGFQQAQQRRRQRNRDIQLQYRLNLKDCFTGKVLSLQYTLPSGRSEFVDVKIPPGVRDGDTVNIQNFGDDSIPNLPRGNLLVRIGIIKPKGWELHNLDLLHNITVSIFDLITGTNIEIYSPEGKSISLKIPKGTQPETTFSIQGYGLPDSNSNRKGSIFVKVKGKTPKVDDDLLLHQIQALKLKIEK